MSKDVYTCRDGIRKALRCKLYCGVVLVWLVFGFPSLATCPFPVTCFSCFSGEKRAWTVVYIDGII